MNKNIMGNITLGLQMGIMVSIFVYGGYRVDRSLGVFPLFLFSGTIVGIASSIYLLLKEVHAEEGEKKEEERDSPWM